MGFASLHRNIKIRIFTSALMRMTGFMVFPFMAIYFSERMGQAAAGLLLLLHVLVIMLTSFYGGYIADRIGRKRVLNTAQAISTGAFFMMAVANTPQIDSAWLTYAMMLVHAVANGLINPAAEAMLIDVSTRENRQFMYRFNYWMMNLSIAVGAMMGGMLFKAYRFELFVALTCVNLFVLILCWAFMTETIRVQEKKGPAKKPLEVLTDIVDNYRLVFKDKLFVLFSAASMLVISLEFQTSNYIGVRLSNEFAAREVAVPGLFSFELTGIKMLSWIQIENTVLVLLGTVVVAKLSKRLTEGTNLYLGILLYTAGFTVLGFSNWLWLLALAVVINSLGELMYVPVRETYLADLVREDARSSYMAVNGLVFQGAKVLGSLGLTIGAFVPSWAMAWAYLVMGVTGMMLFRLAIGRVKKARATDAVQTA